MIDVKLTEEKMKTLKNRQRIKYLDIARTFAIFCVVFCYAVESIYILYNVHDYIALSVQSKVFRIIAFTIGRLGVPIFLFISGFLLLNRNYENDEDIKKFYKNNLLQLFITTEIWIIIYNVYLIIYNNSDLNMQTLIREMLFIENVPLANAWYMPMIIGIYIAIPYIGKILKSFSLKTYIIPMLIIFVISFCVPTINIIFSIYDIKKLGNVFDVSFLGGAYGLYIVSGYCISQGILKKIKNNLIIFIGMFSFMLACGIQILAYKNNIAYNIWYNSPFIFISTISLFELFTRINTNKFNKIFLLICEYISKISLAIYFIHIIIMKILKGYIKILQCSNPIKIILLFLVVFIFSVLLIYLVSKVKLIKKKILFIKD